MTQGQPAASALFKEVVFEKRASLVKEIVAQENAAFDKRTASLRALRLAKQAADVSQHKVSR